MSSGGTFDVEKRRSSLNELTERMSASGFWDRPEEAKQTIGQLRSAKGVVDEFDDLSRKAGDAKALLELAREAEDADAFREVGEMLVALESGIASLELRSVFTDEKDALGAIVSIHPGAGGTESQDWAEMLLRMYLRFFERKGFSSQILDYQPGDEAGIKDATIEVGGEYVYGTLKSESGVHRLVRISPYDAAKRRHTSFASVFVFPRIDETIEVEVRDSDLRVDTYRSSGAGGQHVNKTDSAVRITHIPTGIVVQCQTERSQHRNRENAMKVLRSRLYMHKWEEEQKKVNALYDSQKEIAWGSQIRSYVLQPYTMVKDHRTSHETSSVNAVLDGDLDPFIEAYLKRKP